MRKIVILAVKDLRLLLRDRAGFFFTFFFPVLFAIFFGSIFSGGGEQGSAIDLAVVDEDQSVESRKFIQKLAQASELNVEDTDARTAREMVRKGQKIGYIILKKGFGEAQQQIFLGRSPSIELGVDPSRKAEAAMLEGILTKYAAESMQESLQNPARMRKQVESALRSLKNDTRMPKNQRQILARFFQDLDRFLDKMEKSNDSKKQAIPAFQPLIIERAEIMRERQGPNNAYAVSFPQAIIWGMMGCTAGFGISLVSEKNRGTLIRLRMAPISSMQILAGKALACFMTALGVAFLLFALATYLFGVRTHSFVLFSVAVVVVALAFVGLMMFLSVLGKTERSASGIGWAILLVMAMLGGGMIPLFIMPSWMQKISHFSLVKWAILNIEGAVWRNFSFKEMLFPSAILLGSGVFLFSIGVYAFRWIESD